MTWTVDAETGEVVSPWGDTVGTLEKPIRTPDEVQEIAESMFRDESMSAISTARIADYAQAWMGDVKVINDGD